MEDLSEHIQKKVGYGESGPTLAFREAVYGIGFKKKKFSVMKLNG